MEKILIAVMEGYSNAQSGVRVMEIKENQLPMDLKSGVRCNPLRRLPEFNEYIYLGDHSAHRFPSDVIVTRCDENIKSMIDWCYEAPIKKLAEYFKDTVPSEEKEMDYRDSAACYFFPFFPNKKK